MDFASAPPPSQPLSEVGSNVPPHIPAIRLPCTNNGGKSTTVAPLRANTNALGGGADATKDKDGKKQADDPLTPRILEALAMLDAETAALGALSPRAHESAVPCASEESEPDWLIAAADEVAAVSAESSNPCCSSSCSTSSSGGDAKAEVVLREAETLPVAMSALGKELRQSEEHCRHLRLMAHTQAGTAQEVAAQLELTKSAAEATASAARRIVDDHQADVTLLLAELRRLDPDAAARVEPKLSAPLAALAARRRHAQAASAHRRKQNARLMSPRPGSRRTAAAAAAPSGGGGGGGSQGRRWGRRRRSSREPSDGAHGTASALPRRTSRRRWRGERSRGGKARPARG